jgi:predicted dehydrogenase
MTLRVGILGAAKIAPTALIGPARDRPAIEVACVAARDPARAADFAAEHGIAGTAESYEALIGRDDLDLIYVALPAAAHAQWSIAALEAGKAVLCEKPFARTAAEARAMTAAAQARGRPLIEAFHYRHHAVMHRAVEIVRGGELGPLLTLSATFEVPIVHTPDELRWRDELGGGALMDLGCYGLHAMRTLVGSEPRVVTAQAEVDRGVDVVTRARLEFPGGVEGQLRCAMNPAAPAARLTVRGERGTLDILNFVAPQLGCRFTVERDGVTREEPTAGDSTFGAQLDHVIDVLQNGATPLAGGDDAVANMALIEAVRAASGR